MSRRRSKRMRRYYLRQHSADLIRGRPSARQSSGLDFGSHLNMTGNPVGLTPEREAYLFRRDKWIDRVLKKVYGMALPTSFMPHRSRYFVSPDPWIAVQQAISELEKIADEPAVMDRHITLIDSPTRLEMFWSEDHRRYKFIQFDTKCIRESIVYRSRERAYQVFYQKNITWKKVTPVPRPPDG